MLVCERDSPMPSAQITPFPSRGFPRHHAPEAPSPFLPRYARPSPSPSHPRHSPTPPPTRPTNTPQVPPPHPILPAEPSNESASPSRVSQTTANRQDPPLLNHLRATCAPRCAPPTHVGVRAELPQGRGSSPGNGRLLPSSRACNRCVRQAKIDGGTQALRGTRFAERVWRVTTPHRAAEHSASAQYPSYGPIPPGELAINDARRTRRPILEMQTHVLDSFQIRRQNADRVIRIVPESSPNLITALRRRLNQMVKRTTYCHDTVLFSPSLLLSGASFHQFGLFDARIPGCAGREQSSPYATGWRGNHPLCTSYGSRWRSISRFG